MWASDLTRRPACLWSCGQKYWVITPASSITFHMLREWKMLPLFNSYSEIFSFFTGSRRSTWLIYNSCTHVIRLDAAWWRRCKLHEHEHLVSSYLRDRSRLISHLLLDSVFSWLIIQERRKVEYGSYMFKAFISYFWLKEIILFQQSEPEEKFPLLLRH